MSHITVRLGNLAPITTSYVPTDNQDEAIRVEDGQFLKLERTPVTIENDYDHNNTVTTFRVPGETRLSDALREITTVWRERHSDDDPEWVETDNQGLAAVLSEEFGAQIGRPDDWEGLEYEVSVRPDVDELKALLAEHWPELEIVSKQDLNALRTNAGGDFQARVMGDTASTGTGSYASASYIALTENATAPAAGDTTLTGELTTGGLGRAQATYAHTNGTTTYTLTKAFTSSDGTARTINKVAVFNASSTGTMVFETAVASPPTIISGDQLTVTETVTM